MNTGSYYNDKVVRQFAIMTVVWGIVGMLVGVLIAAQLLWPDLLPAVPWLAYSRLRPLHTNAVIFAFGGSALFATSYYIVQRTCHVRLFADKLAAFTFWGWQLVILLRRHHAAARHHPGQGVRRARVADRPADHGRVGRLRGGVLRHDRAAQGEAHLRGELVLRRLHHHDRGAAHLQQPRHPGDADQVLRHLLGRRRTRWCSGGTGTTRWASS